jgi:hypothetical protein
MTFVEALFSFIFVLLVYVAAYSYHYAIEITGNVSTQSIRVNILSYFVYFMLTGVYSLMTNYIYIQSEITAFNNNNMGASRHLKMQEFVDRLLPKHVSSCERRSERASASRRPKERSSRTSLSSSPTSWASPATLQAARQTKSSTCFRSSSPPSTRSAPD